MHFRDNSLFLCFSWPLPVHLAHPYTCRFLSRWYHRLCICWFSVFRTQHQQKWNNFLVFTFHLNMNWHSQSRLNKNPNIKYSSEGTCRWKLWSDYERLIFKVIKACWLRKSCVPMWSGPWSFIWNSCSVVYTEILDCVFLPAVFSVLKVKVNHNNKTVFFLHVELQVFCSSLIIQFTSKYGLWKEQVRPQILKWIIK